MRRRNIGLHVRGGQEVEVIRAERGVAHGLDARRPMVLFQGEPAEQRAVVDDQDEVAASPTCPRQPPRSQEWGGKGGVRTVRPTAVPTDRAPAMSMRLGGATKGSYVASAHGCGFGA